LPVLLNCSAVSKFILPPKKEFHTEIYIKTEIENIPLIEGKRERKGKIFFRSLSIPLSLSPSHSLPLPLTLSPPPLSSK
jgi:hypothetical protein